MALLNYTELQSQRKKFLSLEKKWEKTQLELLSLPAKMGFRSIEELMEALRDCAHSSVKKKIIPANSRPRGRRSVITPEIQMKVKELISAGKTSAYVANSVGVSVPTVYNIKKRLGLVIPRVR